MRTTAASCHGSTISVFRYFAMSSSSEPTSGRCGSAPPDAAADAHIRSKSALIEEYLACPACKGTLVVGREWVSCSLCAREYPVAGGGLVLIADRTEDFLRRLRARYEATAGGTSLPRGFRITLRLLGDVSGKTVLEL